MKEDYKYSPSVFWGVVLVVAIALFWGACAGRAVFGVNILDWIPNLPSHKPPW